MKHNILLIDDDIDELSFFMSVKKIFPLVTFHYASSVEAGLRLMRKGRPDFILLDINMPAINGYEGFEKIKNEPSLAIIPVIIYSTTIPYHVKKEFLQAGAALCIEKPVTIEGIKAIIEKSFKVVLHN